MKNIYCFEYTFVQDQMGKPQKLEYKTYIVINSEFGETQKDKAEAIAKFNKKYPHVDMTTVYVSEFKGDCIDSFEHTN
jgi:hypothetical protein